MPKKNDEQVLSGKKEIKKIFDPTTGFTVPVFSDEDRMIFDIEELKQIEAEGGTIQNENGVMEASSESVSDPRQNEKNSAKSAFATHKTSTVAKTSINLCLQVHQPFRLRTYPFNEIGKDHYYEQHEQNLKILNRLCDECYLPVNKILMDLISRKKGTFKVSFAISGTALEQFTLHRPDIIESFKSLIRTGCVELLGETYYHSLSSLYSENEFQRQIELHRNQLKEIFGVIPAVFQNTELIYPNDLAKKIEELGFKGLLAEGAEFYLNNRSPNFVYQSKDSGSFGLLLRNYSLSDDVAIRFSDSTWSLFPITAQKFSTWIHDHKHNADAINLALNMEVFDERRNPGILDFLKSLPDEILNESEFCFRTPSEILTNYPADKIYDAADYVSRSDHQYDLSAWTENEMQQEALEKIYSLEKKVLATRNQDLIKVWGKLQASDHFSYMGTKFLSAAQDSPFQSPYDACISYMNVISDLEITIENALQDLKDE